MVGVVSTTYSKNDVINRETIGKMARQLSSNPPQVTLTLERQDDSREVVITIPKRKLIAPLRRT